MTIDKINLTPKGITDALQVLYRYGMIKKDRNGVIGIIDPGRVFWADGK